MHIRQYWMHTNCFTIATRKWKLPGKRCCCYCLQVISLPALALLKACSSAAVHTCLEMTGWSGPVPSAWQVLQVLGVASVFLLQWLPVIISRPVIIIAAEFKYFFILLVYDGKEYYPAVQQQKYLYKSALAS